jgi:hypothetical protein
LGRAALIWFFAVYLPRAGLALRLALLLAIVVIGR